MKIIVDTREQVPYTFARWPEVEVVRNALQTGDYSLSGLENRIALERKSLDDLVGCLMGDARARFERELARGRGLDCFAVLIEAGVLDVTMHRYRSRMLPKAVMASVSAFTVRYGTSFIWCGDMAHAEGMAYSLLSKYRRQLELDLVACIETAPPARKVDHTTIV